MRKSKVSLLLVLTLMLSLIIAPVTQAMEDQDQTIEVEELLFVDINNYINHNELGADIIQRLSEPELQKLREEVVFNYINSNPDVVMEREFTDDEIQKVREQNRERIEELILKKQLQLEPEDNAELINISTNETLNVVLTPNLILLIEDLVSSLVKFHPHSIMVLTEQVEQVLNNILMEKQALTSKA